MKRAYLVVLVLMVMGTWMSCKTDFDINAPAKDIPVVFGLLSPNDTTHYIKITRAFIGEEDAYILAQDPSLSDYGDVLQVRVEEYKSGNLTHTYNCVRTEITNKDTGIFYSPVQYVYSFQGVLSSEATYKLNILNNESGKEITAETNMIRNFTIAKPSYNPNNPIIGFVNSNGTYTSGEVKWSSAVNGRLYESLFRFHYKEVDLTTHDTVSKYLDWSLPSIKASLLTGGEEMLISYESEAFYRFLEARIPVDYNKKRILGKVDFIISVGGDELSTYIDLNEPSNSIIQERPAFTNISEGVGIFSCRYTRKLTFSLSSYSVQELLTGPYTSQLGFQ
jgi:hypothetical protein